MAHTSYAYEGNGYEPGAILLKLYGDEAWRTVCIPIDEQHMPWRIASELNQAYERGRREAFEDLRNLIGAAPLK